MRLRPPLTSLVLCLSSACGTNPIVTFQQPVQPDAEDASVEADAAEEDAGMDAAVDAAPDDCIVREAATNVDLLFMVDNSGSMAQEQELLGQKLSRLVNAITAGDKEAGREQPSNHDYEGRHFTPPRSLHIGVVTSDLGGPPAVRMVASAACGPQNGNNGVLAVSGAIAAQDQLDANTRTVVKAAVPECADVSLSPPYLAFGTDGVDGSDRDALDAALFDFSCVSTVGVNGCGIEQPLESLWKALAPASVDDFVGPDTRGQGDRENAGFLREDSVLAVVLVSDEDDCSVTEDGAPMFERAGAAGEPAVNVRCQLLAEHPDYEHMLQPVSRYVDGLVGLRSALPERLLFAAVVGVPGSADLEDLDALIADPAMSNQLDSAAQGGTDLLSVCGSDLDQGKAYPGRRAVKVAQGIREKGGTAVVSSICAPDYSPVLDTLVDKIGEQLINVCKPVL